MAKPKMLLHICCAPCSTHAIEVLKEQYDIDAYFYNPNIHPEEEYRSRLNDMKKFSVEQGIKLIEGTYDVEAWHYATMGLEDEPEGGKRCPHCYRLRLSETARLAKNAGYDYIATTLTVSPHKKATVINAIGAEEAAKAGLKFHIANFKRGDGFKHSVELSRRHGLRRQDYCGCIYSKRERLTKSPARDSSR